MITELVTRDRCKDVFSRLKKQGMEGLVWSVGLRISQKGPCDIEGSHHLMTEVTVRWTRLHGRQLFYDE